MEDTCFPEHLTCHSQRELDLDGAPGSLAHLCGLIAPVSDYRLPSSPAQAVLFLLRSHMQRLPMCNVCPASLQDSARRHAALDCPTALGKFRGLGMNVGNLRRLAPEHMTIFAHDPASGRQQSQPRPLVASTGTPASRNGMILTPMASRHTALDRPICAPARHFHVRPTSAETLANRSHVCHRGRWGLTSWRRSTSRMVQCLCHLHLTCCTVPFLT